MDAPEEVLQTPATDSYTQTGDARNDESQVETLQEITGERNGAQ